jgi:hypothetical protein
MTHLTYETLLNYMEERLSPQERAAAEAHLAPSCESCEQRMAQLRKVLQSVQNDHTTPPPASVLKQAMEIPLTKPRPSQPGRWTRLIASLSFDSHLQLSSTLTRGASRERQMLFTAEQMDIDLKISSGRGGHDVLGQLLGAPQTGEAIPVFVSLQSNSGAFLKVTETDSQGQFVFREISSGVYDLFFDLETQQIAVQGLQVRND